VTTGNTTAPDPVLHWAAIAAHAWAEHGTRWATDTDAVTAIIAAFDAILPSNWGYNAADGSIRPRPGDPPGPLLAWRDPQMLGCTIATLAAHLSACDLQAIYGTETIIVARTPPPAGPRWPPAADPGPPSWN
jgi:hypothetical protein